MFGAMRTCEAKCDKAADKAHPVPPGARSDEIEAWAEHSRDCLEKAHKRLAARYGVTTGELAWIADEGVKKRW